MLTVASGHAIRDLPAHHSTGIPHNEVALARLVLIVQEVVDLESVETDHVPDLLAPHPGFTAIHQHPQVTKQAQIITCVGVKLEKRRLRLRHKRTLLS